MAGANTFPHVLEATDLDDLASIHVSELDFGAICFVVSVNASFFLTDNPVTPPDGVTVVAPVPQAAVGKPGAAWQKESSGGGGTPLVIEEDAVALPQRNKLNFVGPGFALTDNGPNASTDVTAVPPAPPPPLVIEEDAVALPQRNKLNFVGSGFALTDNGPNASTDVTAVPPPSLVIEKDAVALPSQNKLNFVGSGFAVSNNVPNASTDVVAVPQPASVYGISGIQQTSRSDGLDERGAIFFDPSRYFATGRVIVFTAVLESATGGGETCQLELFNRTDGLTVTTLSTNATAATVVTSAPLAVPADLPNGPRLYVLRLSRGGGITTDQVACKAAFLDVSYP